MMSKIKMLIIFVALIPTLSFAKNVNCPSRNFSQFLASYENNVTLQKIFTRKPLFWRNLDEDDRSFKSLSLKTNDDIPFPLVLSIKKWRELYGKDFKITTIKTNNNKYTLLAQTTAPVRTDNFKMKFYFQRHDQCWYLHQVDNLIND